MKSLRSRTLPFITLLVLIPLLSSCATMFRGSSENAYVIVLDESVRDSSLKLMTADEAPIALRRTEIPSEFKVVIPHDTKWVIAEHADKRQYIRLSRSLNGTVFLSFLLDIVPIIVDDATGAAFNYDDIILSFDSTTLNTDAKLYAQREDIYQERPKIMLIGSAGLPLQEAYQYGPHGEGGLGLSYLKKLEATFQWSSFTNIRAVRLGAEANSSASARTFAARLYPVDNFFVELGYSWIDMHVSSVYQGPYVFPSLSTRQQAFVPAIGWSGDFSFICVKRWAMSPPNADADLFRVLDFYSIDVGLNIRF